MRGVGAARMDPMV